MSIFESGGDTRLPLLTRQRGWVDPPSASAQHTVEFWGRHVRHDGAELTAASVLRCRQETRNESDQFVIVGGQVRGRVSRVPPYVLSGPACKRIRKQALQFLP